MNILGFKKNQLIIVTFILVAIGFATYINLIGAYRKSRDQQRKGDIRAIHDALVAYQEDIASFPASDNGLIVACFGGVDENDVPQRIPCKWGWDGLPNIFEEGMPTYIRTLPTDPHHNQGVRYVYLSNGRRFQILGALEGKNEDEYDESIVARHIMCGTEVCNFGRAFNTTPLDKSIEEYENELRKLQDAKN